MPGTRSSPSGDGTRPARATIADVAREAGVSRTTVSHALSGKGRVDPSTRAHVREVANSLGYHPSPRAQSLRRGRSGMVAIMTALPPEIVGEHSEMGFLLDMAMPAARALLEHGVSLVLVPPGAAPRHIDELDIDGAIVIDPRVDDAHCRRLAARGVRVVTVGIAEGTGADAGIDRRIPDGDPMLDHLEAQGAREIAVMLSSQAHSIAVHLAGMLDERDGRWGSARVRVIHVDAASGEEGGREAAARLLREHPETDAVYAPLDAFAVGAVEAAKAAGLDVPGDLMVATNYDGPRAAASQPRLTALDLRLAETALLASDLLVRTLAGEEPDIVMAPAPALIARASTLKKKDNAP
jgi:DNA-binding LacI/PurR family transcriptional regulator